MTLDAGYGGDGENPVRQECLASLRHDGCLSRQAGEYPFVNDGEAVFPYRLGNPSVGIGGGMSRLQWRRHRGHEKELARRRPGQTDVCPEISRKRRSRQRHWRLVGTLPVMPRDAGIELMIHRYRPS
jgi:hypothetical protein